MKNIIFLFIIFGFLITSACTKGGAQVVLQGISFTPDTITVSVNCSMQLTPVFTPSVFSSIPVEWSSTDNSVVSVSSNGVLTTNLTKGQAWIKIKDKYSATTGKCLVIVQ
ncbi:Ig-like domain-containing protein [Mucilaginibacter boryungensis]|uniref:Ig-like domain-containing protein n=1 Tax=Mucilaginibacter boryungensis TaxID=768480 RepID=A0ABR9XG93_9SPHI|nr:Ig-like domain-containing protein [Mucilaginibacter boryungensis]